MSTQNIDIKHIAKLPSIKSWKSDELARRMAFRLFSNLKHGELIVREGNETRRFGGHDLSIAPSVTVTINDPRAYSRIVMGGTIGGGEAYIDGDWSTEELTEVTRGFQCQYAAIGGHEGPAELACKSSLKTRSPCTPKFLHGITQKYCRTLRPRQ